MSAGALSEATMLAALQDIRLPATAPGGLVAEIAVAAGLGGLVALAVLAALSVLTGPRRSTRPQRLPERIAALHALPEAERRVALLHLLKHSAPDAHARLRPRLYATEGVSLAEIEAEVSRLA